MRGLNGFRPKKDFCPSLDNKSLRNDGFTLLELMIAVAIFGFLMLSISQLMRFEIRNFNTGSAQNEIQQKARTAMMHILDEINRHPYTYFSPASPPTTDSGVYYTLPLGTLTCLIDVSPTNLSSLPSGTELYYDAPQHRLWFRDNTKNTTYLVSDEIYTLTITPVEDDVHLVQIDLVAGDPNTPQTFELLTWVRLY
ncbi:Type II secretory pathway, pseudopilin PulG [Desulfosporosinus metallidurans]|uniref:Type II secretory pathway, pseudopilin PulG n=1 Tax=Desulfosporosinus metallidurans TaxID=1888891 RepID=A0A1Q8QY57_9FIRM|nr:prepilin-type N-terminal cleavage/methylation domain-containing protein [Desulfosporosinus metallidurans]OLN32235.1 Type II secretory pathway, pseudopilin PulG [Desulfosporosinus metallidurans]